MQILIADDDPLFQHFIHSHLTRWGYEIISCQGGEEAWHFLQQEEAPSLAVIDWMMPDLNGLELCRKVRAKQSDIQPYLLLVTARNRKEDIVTGLEAGFDDYMMKPVSALELKARIQVGVRHIEQQQQLQARQRELWNFFDYAGELIQQVSPDGHFLYVNRAWREILGYDDEDLATLSVFDIIHPDSQAHCMELFQRILAGGQIDHIEAQFLSKNGKKIAVEGSSSCHFIDGQEVIAPSIFHNVTTRRRRETREHLLANMRDIIWEMQTVDDIKKVVIALQHSLETLEVPFDNGATNFIETTNGQQRVTFFSFSKERGTVDQTTRKVATESGVQRIVKMMQSKESVYCPDLDVDDPFSERVRLESAIRSVLEVPFSHGTLAVNSFAPHAFSDEDIAVLQLFAGVLSEGFQRQEDLFRITTSERRYRALVETLDQQVKERTAELQTLNDQLRQEIIERQTLQRSLIQSERLAAVGTVTAGIVHNLNNPLQCILGYGELLTTRHPQLEEPKEIVQAVLHVNQMIEGILVKTRQKKRAEPLNLNTVLCHELDFLNADQVFKYNIEKILNLSEALPSIQAFYTDWSQIFGNLLHNAVEAMYGQDEKRLSISTQCTGDDIQVEIGDTGEGIPPEEQSAIFKPFVTTKIPQAGESGPVGTGLGLFTVKQLLDTYNASIECQSVVGKGTLFRVKVPVI